jgi:putative aminopeptidase FrvX
VVFDDHRQLLQELLTTYGPCGQEDAVRAICARELEPHVDELWTDSAGNLVGLIRGSQPGAGPVVRVFAHLDELSMIVKRVEGDGSLAAARTLAEDRPQRDVYFVMSTSEEMGGIGATYASRALPDDVTLALDVAPRRRSTRQPRPPTRSSPTPTRRCSTTRRSLTAWSPWERSSG